MPVPAAVKLTYEDLQSLPVDGRRHELIDGEHLVTPAPSTRHQRVLRRLFEAVQAAAVSGGLGEVFFAPVDVVLSAVDVAEPDLLFVSMARAGIVSERGIEAAPDLVVEVVSPSTRRVDEVVKRKLYDRFGVLEYWVVDPELATVKAYRRTDEGFGPPLELSVERSDVLATPLLLGLQLPLVALFG